MNVKRRLKEWVFYVLQTNGVGIEMVSFNGYQIEDGKISKREWKSIKK